MSRYFFHVEDGRSYPDLDGTELADVDAARIASVRMFGALLADDPVAFWNGDEWALRCTDADQMTLFKIHFYAIDAPAAPPRKLKPKPLEALPTEGSA